MILASLLGTAAMLLATATATVGGRRPDIAKVVIDLTHASAALTAGLLLLGLWQRGAVLVAALTTILVASTTAVIWRLRATDEHARTAADFRRWERELTDREVTGE